MTDTGIATIAKQDAFNARGDANPKLPNRVWHWHPNQFDVYVEAFQSELDRLALINR